MLKSGSERIQATPKVKIGFVLDDTLDTPDGVQQYILTVGDWLSKQGYEVHYLVGETRRVDISNVHSMAKNISIRFNKNKLSIPLPSSKKLIHKKIQKLNLDILHVQMPYSPLFAGRVIKAVPDNVKVIGTFHIVPASWLERTGAKSLQLITRATLRRFDSIISVSNAAQSFAKTVFGVDSVVIPNAVNVSRFKHDPITTKEVHIVFLGRLVERKGCIWLLKALRQVQVTYKNNYKVTIAGKGPLASKLKQYVTKHGIKKVKFVGFIKEEAKPKLLASADIAVFPSTSGESFGIVLIEAMASNSRVVMGGDNIGYRSVLSGYPNLLIDSKNTTEFAKQLLYFMNNKQAREKALHWNSHEVLKYDVSNVGRQLENIYTE